MNKYKITLFSVLILFSNFFNTQVFSAEVIMPSILTADTSSFVLLSDSGTTPSISGYSRTLLVSATINTYTHKLKKPLFFNIEGWNWL